MSLLNFEIQIRLGSMATLVEVLVESENGKLDRLIVCVLAVIHFRVHELLMVTTVEST